MKLESDRAISSEDGTLVKVAIIVEWQAEDYTKPDAWTERDRINAARSVLKGLQDDINRRLQILSISVLTLPEAK